MSGQTRKETEKFSIFSPDGLAVEEGEGQDPDAHPHRAPHLGHVTAHLEILTNLENDWLFI